jgi:hypothetical protein
MGLEWFAAERAAWRGRSAAVSWRAERPELRVEVDGRVAAEKPDLGAAEIAVE